MPYFLFFRFDKHQHHAVHVMQRANHQFGSSVDTSLHGGSLRWETLGHCTHEKLCADKRFVSLCYGGVPAMATRRGTAICQFSMLYITS